MTLDALLGNLELTLIDIKYTTGDMVCMDASLNLDSKIDVLIPKLVEVDQAIQLFFSTQATRVRKGYVDEDKLRVVRN